jgi:hypothetical protein
MSLWRRWKRKEEDWKKGGPQRWSGCVLKRIEEDPDERWIQIKGEWVERWSEGEKLVGKLLEKSNRESLGEDVSYMLISVGVQALASNIQH